MNSNQLKRIRADVQSSLKTVVGKPPWVQIPYPPPCSTAPGVRPHAEFVVLDPQRLATSLSGADTSVLMQGEWREICFYGIASLGGVIFNAWD